MRSTTICKRWFWEKGQFQHLIKFQLCCQVISLANAQDRANFNVLAHMVKEEPMESGNVPPESTGLSMPSTASFASLLDITKDEEMDIERSVFISFTHVYREDYGIDCAPVHEFLYSYE